MSLCVEWTTGEQIRALGGPDLPPSFNEEMADLGATLASSILYQLTGRRWNGLCEQTVRPSGRATGPGGPRWPITVTAPWTGSGSTFDWRPGAWTWFEGWGECSCDAELWSACSCSGRSMIPLGAFPIQSIVSVTLDGDTLIEGTDYRLVDKQLLERAPGEVWPFCQDLFAEPTEPDTFEVVYLYGQVPDSGGDTIATIYGLEIARGLAGAECNLPSRVSSILRQGTTISFADPSTLAQNGLTGVPLVDTWIMAVNGGQRPHRAASIASPDRLPRVEYRWPTSPAS